MTFWWRHEPELIIFKIARWVFLWWDFAFIVTSIFVVENFDYKHWVLYFMCNLPQIIVA